ncbi:MAG: flavin reductase family protein [Pyrinomonadaceae bacterium]
MPISPDEFRAALSKFASGVTVVTTKDAGGTPHGITVSAFCSVSLEPPLILVCIEKNAYSHAAFGESGVFVVNILSDQQIDHSNQFASPALDRFDGIKCREGLEGVLILEEALVNLECRLVNSHENGDHTIFIGRIERATVKDGKPLLYFHGNYRAMEDLLSEPNASGGKN